MFYKTANSQSLQAVAGPGRFDHGTWHTGDAVGQNRELRAGLGRLTTRRAPLLLVLDAVRAFWISLL
jgi:hypothetical protein